MKLTKATAWHHGQFSRTFDRRTRFILLAPEKAGSGFVRGCPQRACVVESASGAALAKAAWLAREALRIRQTGIGLKEAAPDTLLDAEHHAATV